MLMANCKFRVKSLQRIADKLYLYPNACCIQCFMPSLVIFTFFRQGVHKYHSIDATEFLKEKVDPLPKLAVQLMNGNYGNLGV